MLKRTGTIAPAASRSPLTAARDLIWWLLSPYAYATAALAVRTRCRVLVGPFAGMRYPFGSVTRMLLYGPSQVGCYERELHPVVEEMIATGPGLVVNVGAAGGYYAVGLARRLPGADVIAYESEPGRRAAVSRLAALNRVESRVDIRGTCTVAELAALAPSLAGRRACVVLDCEGAESELVDPEAVPWLAGASLLAELHPSVDPGIAALLERRLADTHETRLITAEQRWASQIAELWQMPGLRDIDRELLVAEYRHGIQQWLCATPRAM